MKKLKHMFTSKSHISRGRLIRTCIVAAGLACAFCPAAGWAQAKNLIGPPGQAKNQYTTPDDKKADDYKKKMMRKQIDDIVKQLRNNPGPLPTPEPTPKPAPSPAAKTPDYTKPGRELFERIDQFNRKTYPFLYNQGNGTQVNRSPNRP